MKLLNRTLLVILAIGVAAASGCVYWRLLQFKRQLEHFPEHFAFHDDSPYTLISLHPVLSDEDVDDIMELEPSHSGRDADGPWRAYAFAKDPPDGSPDLVYRFGFDGEMLWRIEFPEQFTRLYPGPVLRELLASLGTADLDRDQRAAHGRMMREQIVTHLPNRAVVRRVLGAPVMREMDEGVDVWSYHYRPVTSTKGRRERKRHAYGRFHFGSDGELVTVEAGIGRHSARFDIEDALASDSEKE